MGTLYYIIDPCEWTLTIQKYGQTIPKFRQSVEDLPAMPEFGNSQGLFWPFPESFFHVF